MCQKLHDNSGPAGFRQEIEPTKGELVAETGQDPEWDSDEEPTEERMVENQRRRYSLREKGFRV